jgi:hypothetical protein
MMHFERPTFSDPVQMIDSLGEAITLHKGRHFALCCCRRIWDLLDDHCKHAVETAERRSTGLVTIEEIRDAVTSIIRWYAHEASRSAAQAVHIALYDPLIISLYQESTVVFRESNLVAYSEDALKPRLAFAKYASIHTAYAKAFDSESRMDVVRWEYEEQCRLLDTILSES